MKITRRQDLESAMNTVCIARTQVPHHPQPQILTCCRTQILTCRSLRRQLCDDFDARRCTVECITRNTQVECAIFAEKRPLKQQPSNQQYGTYKTVMARIWPKVKFFCIFQVIPSPIGSGRQNHRELYIWRGSTDVASGLRLAFALLASDEGTP